LRQAIENDEVATIKAIMEEWSIAVNAWVCVSLVPVVVCSYSQCEIMVTSSCSYCVLSKIPILIWSSLSLMYNMC